MRTQSGPAATPVTTPLLVSIDSAAGILGVSKATVRRMLQQQLLLGRRIGRRRLVVLESVSKLATGGVAP